MIKKYVKKILGEDELINNSTFDENNFSKSLKTFVENNPLSVSKYKELSGRKDGKQFYPAVKEIEKGYNLLFKDLHKYDNGEEESIVLPTSSGDPMRTKPFPLCREYILRMLFGKYMYRYPNAAGHIRARQKIVDYLKREGFKIEKDNNYDGIGVDNIVFTCSTTHAYNMILSTIVRDEDVVLLTGPNYGLFAIEPERLNAKVEILELKEKDNWYVNADDLSKRIDEINEKLKKEFANKLNYIPRVVAFLNMNPHNPLGKVMNNKNKDILIKIGDVCLEKGIFVIDDLIYRDLTFDQNDLALPMASIPKYFNNTISLMGISKSYGLAGMRAGVVIAPIPICNNIKSIISSTMDSIPVLQVQAVAGAFNGSNRRYKMTKKYFKPIIKEYKYRLYLFQALVEGIDSIRNYDIRKRIINDLDKYIKNKKRRDILLKGIPYAKIRKGTMPESGFFAIIDFTDLKGMKYDNKIINDDCDLLEYLYKEVGVKCIMGINMSWSNKDEIIARINYALDIKDLILNLDFMNKAISELKTND